MLTSTKTKIEECLQSENCGDSCAIFGEGKYREEKLKTLRVCQSLYVTKAISIFRIVFAKSYALQRKVDQDFCAGSKISCLEMQRNTVRAIKFLRDEAPSDISYAISTLATFVELISDIYWTAP